MLRRFTPNWFTVGMGTGITAVVAYTQPWAPMWLQYAATALWLANIGLVALFCVLFIGRLATDGRAMREILHDPVQSMFLGAIPMAITTIVNGFVDMGQPLFGHAAIAIAEPLWLFNVALAVASAIVVPYAMFVSHDHRLDRMTGVWLMPFVPPEVVAASGGLLLPHVASLAMARALLTGSLVLWALSVPTAFLLLGLLLLRLSLHKLPPREMAISTWITLGTLGTGVMGMVGLGRSMPLLFGPVGHAMDGAAVLAALALWGFGLWWLVISVVWNCCRLAGQRWTAAHSLSIAPVPYGRAQGAVGERVWLPALGLGTGSCERRFREQARCLSTLANRGGTTSPRRRTTSPAGSAGVSRMSHRRSYPPVRRARFWLSSLPWPLS